MWIVVYVSASRNSAQKVAKALADNEIISRLRHTDKEDTCFEVLVPQAELASAQELIFDNELF